MSDCSFYDSDWQDTDACDKCKTKEIKFCEVYEGSKLSTKQRYSGYKNTCSKAVFIRDKDSVNYYQCGKNGGICDFFKYRKCKLKTE